MKLIQKIVLLFFLIFIFPIRLEVYSAPKIKIIRFIKSERVRLRSGPGITFNEVGYLHIGNEVEVLEKEGSWAKVRYTDKIVLEGWCLSIFLSVKKPSVVVLGPKENPKVIQIAKAYIGINYRWGGTTSRGFDCSGFVLAMYRKVGIKLPRTAAEQFKIGKYISLKDLESGDRVFFHTYKRGASHVGIYIGQGNFIHASSRGVIISSLSEVYYSKRYLGARR